jgi:hypothetical protein
MQSEKNKECFKSGLLKDYSYMAVIDGGVFFNFLTIKTGNRYLRNYSLNPKLFTNVIVDESYCFFYPPIDVIFKNSYNSSLFSYIKKNNIVLPDSIVIDSVSFYEFTKNSDCKYYVKDVDDSYVYKFYYLKGYALRHFALNEHNNENIPGGRYINEAIPACYVYFWYKFDSIDCDSPPPGFKEWNPELNCEEYVIDWQYLDSCLWFAYKQKVSVFNPNTRLFEVKLPKQLVTYESPRFTKFWFYFNDNQFVVIDNNNGGEKNELIDTVYQPDYFTVEDMVTHGINPRYSSRYHKRATKLVEKRKNDEIDKYRKDILIVKNGCKILLFNIKEKEFEHTFNTINRSFKLLE